MTLKPLLKKTYALAGVEQPATSHAEKLISALGAFAGIVGVWWISVWSLGSLAAMMMVASMGASAVLLFAVPHGTLSQPWPVIGGHLISGLTGVACQQLLPGSPWTAPLAVGLAVGAMYYLRCIHPPGGATALTAVVGGEAVHALGFAYLLFPVALNVASILCVAVLFNSPFKWRRYPGHFAAPRPTPASAKPGQAPELTQEDFAAALQELDSLVDVTAEDLVDLFERAAKHAERNAQHPSDVVAGGYYSNGRLGQRWSVRQVIDASDTAGKMTQKVIYKTVAGDGVYQTGICSEAEFKRWARFEVMCSNGHWLRVDAEQQSTSQKKASG